MKPFIWLIALSSSWVWADTPGNVSMGIGSDYAGLGVKYAVPIAGNLRAFANLGFAGYAEYSGSHWGFGGGLEMPLDGNHHVVGLFAEKMQATSNEYYESTDLGVTYSYYFSGLGHRGWSLGVDYTQRDYSLNYYDDKQYVGVHFGYSY